MEKHYTLEHKCVDEIPYSSTILSNNDVFLSDCPKCDRTRFNYSNRDLAFLIEGKGVLPDFLLCGHYPLKIVSDSVIKAWKSVNISGFESFPVRLVDVKNKEITNAQQYHNIIITGKAELDFQKMGIEITRICDECGAVEYSKETWEFGVAAMKERTYDGSDLFTFKHFEGAPLCSLKVLKTVFDNKLTNFNFKSLETKFIYFTPTPDINLEELFK